ncbi:MAG: hypothetical protein ACRCUT_08595, partial [Spirochaetota bacterium]
MMIAIIFPCGCFQNDSSKPDKSISSLSQRSTTVSNGTSIEDLAYHWAPIHYQDLYAVNGDQSRVDYITRIDRSADGTEGGEWNVANNWDKKLSYPLRAYVYYSIVESDSHYFITYNFFHPWDTQIKPDPEFDPHVDKEQSNVSLADIMPDSFSNTDFSMWNFLMELTPVGLPFEMPIPKIVSFESKREWETNDLEGVLFVVKKQETFGELEAVFSEAHGYLQVYLTKEGDKNLNAISERKRPFQIEPVEDVHAYASMNDSVKRIITTQEAQGHGAGCYPDWGAPSPGNILDPLSVDKRHTNGSKIERLIEKPSGGDHIRYIPTRGEPEEPDYSELESNKYTYCKYKLINVFEENGMWDNRYNPNV